MVWGKGRPAKGLLDLQRQVAREQARAAEQEGTFVEESDITRRMRRCCCCGRNVFAGLGWYGESWLGGLCLFGVSTANVEAFMTGVMHAGNVLDTVLLLSDCQFHAAAVLLCRRMDEERHSWLSRVVHSGVVDC